MRPHYDNPQVGQIGIYLIIHGWREITGRISPSAQGRNLLLAHCPPGPEQVHDAARLSAPGADMLEVEEIEAMVSKSTPLSHSRVPGRAGTDEDQAAVAGANSLTTEQSPNHIRWRCDPRRAECA
jgi:hypothetical protein